MKLSQKDQDEFAKKVLAIAESTHDVNILTHLLELSGIVISWAGEDNGVPVLLNEYLYEKTAMASGVEDMGWKDEFKKKLDAELEIIPHSQGATTAKLPRKDQIRLAEEVLDIIGDETIDITTLEHLKRMVSLLVSWVGHDNGVAINLSEYIGELVSIKKGKGDKSWKDEFRKTLLEELTNPNY